MKKDVEVERLVVNPENYRFDPVDKPSEAIDLMLEEKGEEIFTLARHIYEHGLDKAKDTRVLEVKKDLFLVLDGNRRITAIKCLHDPGLVKNTALRNKFLGLLKGKGHIPKKVNCYIYADEKDASEWIKLDHTGKNNGVGQDPWEPAGKDRFDYKFSGKISPAMQTVNLFQAETKKQIDTKALKISTLNRILSNPESRSYVGIDIKNGQVFLAASKKAVLARLDQLFNKMIIDDVAVKEVYYTADSTKFMRDLFGNKPTVTKTVTPISTKGMMKKAQSLKSLPKSAGRNILIPSGCVLQIHEVRVNNIYHELKSVPLDAATNAIAVLFRVFLETSLDCYAGKNGITFGSQTKLAGKITKVADSLEKKKVATATQLKNIRRVATKGNTILSIENFHEYVHSSTVQPVPVDLIYKWDNLQEFFEILLGQHRREPFEVKKEKMKFYSPLRYPGGKHRLAKFVSKICETNSISGHYVEPYAGGAAVALFLLLEGRVSKITINDNDRSIYAFWYSVLHDTDNLCRLIKDVKIDVATWREQKEVQKNKARAPLSKLGFSTFFLNRTNMSGILDGGLIGGTDQKGPYKIDCRFNKKALIERIKKIAKHKNNIRLFKLDALELVEKIAQETASSGSTIFYFDPPYYLKGESLYMNYYGDKDHRKVSRAIKKIKNTHWIVSYDNVSQVRKMYNGFRKKEYKLLHTAREAKEGREILFFSKGLKLPRLLNPLTA